MSVQREKRKEWMSEWVNEWMSEWVNEWMSEWVNEWKIHLEFENGNKFDKFICDFLKRLAGNTF